MIPLPKAASRKPNDVWVLSFVQANARLAQAALISVYIQRQWVLWYGLI